MGTVASIYRIPKSKIQDLKEDVLAKEKVNSQMIYLDKLWEPVLFIFGNGFLGREPFVKIFMPKNNLKLSEEQEKIGRAIKYHDKVEIEEIETAISEIGKTTIEERFDVEKINKTVMYQIQEDDKEILINHCLEIKDLFRKAKEEDDIVVCSPG